MDNFLLENGIDIEVHGVLSRPRFLDVVGLLSKMQEEEDHPPSDVRTESNESPYKDIPTMEEAARLVSVFVSSSLRVPSVRLSLTILIYYEYVQNHALCDGCVWLFYDSFCRI